MGIKSVFWLAMLTTLTAVYGCDGPKPDGGKMVYSSMKDVPDSAWKKLAEKRIYFGHQSVGQNILSGVGDVLRDDPRIRLNLTEIKGEAALGTPQFAHSAIGSNGDPKSKIEAFTALMDKGVGNSANIAFFKFCYIDFNPSTDVETLFQLYKQTMGELRKRHPNTTFIHVTVPLMVMQTGPKAWIKSLLGRPISGYEDNIKRCQFNELMRKEYGGKAPVFDLAAIESTYSDGRRSSFEKDGKTYYHLIQDYTYDDGHLNEKGRRIAADHLLVLLAGL